MLYHIYNIIIINQIHNIFSQINLYIEKVTIIFSYLVYYVCKILYLYSLILKITFRRQSNFKIEFKIQLNFHSTLFNLVLLNTYKIKGAYK